MGNTLNCEASCCGDKNQDLALGEPEDSKDSQRLRKSDITPKSKRTPNF